MKRVSLLVIDLDNTLWDWFAIWHASFSQMLEELIRVSGISRETLIEEIMAVHQRHHTSEYSFVLQELPCLELKFGRKVDPSTDLPSVIEAARKGRQEQARLYDGVAETLRVIKSRGTRIVAFTESQIFYTSQRLRKFELDGVIDVLYSTPDQSALSVEELAGVRNFEASHYQLKKTLVRPLPSRLLKPSAEILIRILQDEAQSVDEAIYVGDSLVKDVLMAKRAKVCAVHAGYGSVHNDPRYELLREVTHWTPDDVEREKKCSKEEVAADFTLNHDLGELFKYFYFVPSPPADLDGFEKEIEIWKETVATQRHFNELQLQLRSILVTLLTAVVGAAGYAMSQGSSVNVFGVEMTLGAVVALAGIIALIALRFYERGYHQLLLGAVSNGLKIEKRLERHYPGIRLAHEIGESSHKKNLFRVQFSSSWRNRAFYFVCFSLLVGLFFVAFFSKKETKLALDQGPASQLALETYYARKYHIGVEQICSLAKASFDKEAQKISPEKQVVIFDIDETALSTWPILAEGCFKWDSKLFEAFVNEGRGEPVLPVLELYNYVRSKGAAVVFISSRSEKLREPTERNLRSVGFRNFEKVVLKPNGDSRSTRDYKESARNEIASKRTIVLNLGDQLSDLSMPVAKYEFLIPNPFYTTN